tara:strand:- start:472 stop:654 length:183 start_codon:yes stop_codon:yes gene_type:complete
MAKQDYVRFLFKVEQLNKLVESIKDSPEKYELFINCKTHKEVVELAKKWGFEIGKQWGEP